MEPAPGTTAQTLSQRIERSVFASSRHLSIMVVHHILFQVDRNQDYLADTDNKSYSDNYKSDC